MLSSGAMSQLSTAFRFNLLPDEDRIALMKAGAVGDVLFNFYNIKGKLVDHPVNKRIMSIPLEQLRGVPLRVISAGGSDKIEAMLGAIKLIDCNALITNEETAKALLNYKH